MKKHLFALLLASQTYLCADSYQWGAGAPISTLPNFVIGPQLAYDPANQTMIATFANNTVSPALPYYSFFTNGSWGPSSQIGAGSGALSEVGLPVPVEVTYYGRDSAHVWVAAWCSYNDTDHDEPAYSVYNGSTWSAAAAIGGGTQGAGLGISIASFLDTSLGHQAVMAAWTQSHQPGGSQFRYSLYDGVSLNFSIQTHIIGVLSFAFINLVSLGDSVMATYVNSGDAHPYYTIYSATPGPLYTWSTPMQIPNSLPVDNTCNVYSAYDPVNNRVVAVWNSSSTPYYSIYQNGSWSTPAVIPFGIDGTAINSIAITYNPDAQAFAATGESLSGTNYYSVLTGTTWSQGQIIPPINGASYISLDYNPSLHLIFAGWNNPSPDGPPFFTTLNIIRSPTPSSGITPPTNVIEILRQNRFLSQSQFCAQILWGATTSTSAVGYYVYKNGRLIAILPITATCFTDPNSNRCNTYQVSAFNSAGDESTRVVAGPNIR